MYVRSDLVVYSNDTNSVKSKTHKIVSYFIGFALFLSFPPFSVLLNSNPSFINPSNTALKIINCKLIEAIELKRISLKVAFTFVLYKINVCKIFTKNAVILGIVSGIVGIVTPTNIITGTQIIFITAITGPNASLNQKNQPVINLFF